jgi:hypothetical protein
VTGEARFERIAEGLLAEPGVTRGTGFGSTPGLRVDNRIFAMLVRGDLVVKLPRQRVDALVEAGAAERFDPRHDGRLMKEWAVVSPRHADDWQGLASEALAFVG